MAGMSSALRRALGMADEAAAGSDEVIDSIRAIRAAREAEAADFLRKMGDDAASRLPTDIQGRRHAGDWPAGTESWARPEPAFWDGMADAAQSQPDMSLDSPLFRQMYKADQAFTNLRKGRTANLRNQNPDFVRIAADRINSADEAAAAARKGAKADDAKRAAATAALGAAGVGLMTMPTLGPKEPQTEAGDLTESGNPAELRDEPVSTAAAVATPVAPPAPVAPPPPVDYAYQARQILARLNAMRRAAGGEVPEAPHMIAEANRLLAMSDQQRNAPGYQPAMPTDYHGQATLLLQKLNQMRRQAGGEVPEAPQMMAEIRRLQAMGDKQRNTY